MSGTYSARSVCRAIAAPEILGDTAFQSPSEQPQQLSYSQQYQQLFQKPLDTKKIVPKPSKEAQKLEPDGRKVLLSDVYATPKTNLFKNRSWAATDKQYIGFMLFIHGLCLAAPFTFSWPMVGLFLVSYFITGCLGITLSYHRQLSHRSFATPKWLEYALAYCGVLAIQGEPMEWVSSHRYHHLHTDTPLDPHSPYEGFWWSHMGWLLDNKVSPAILKLIGYCNDTMVKHVYIVNDDQADLGMTLETPFCSATLGDTVCNESHCSISAQLTCS